MLILRLFTFLTLLLFTACSSTFKQHEASTQAYKLGKLTQAESILTKTISKEMPRNNFQQSKEAVYLLLNRATTRFASGNLEGAIADYNIAIEALDYYAQENILDITGQLFIDDSWGAYNGSDLEHLLARIYFALALMSKGDLNNAYALLRQAEEMQQFKAQKYSSVPCMSEISCHENALGKFLFASLLHRQGDHSNAAILFQQAQTLSGHPLIELSASFKNHQDKATVIIICHNGNVPFKISTTTTASVASTLALEAILCTRRIDPVWSSLSGIPTPQLCQQSQSEPIPTYACINNIDAKLSPWLDVAKATHNELEQKKPLIVARGVARYLLRRAAVAQAQTKDPNLGALLDIGMVIANANTEADTRAWSTLPSSIDLVHYHLTPGTHCLKISVARSTTPNFQKNIPLKLKTGDLCVINIFNINPQTTNILVPHNFISKEIPHE